MAFKSHVPPSFVMESMVKFQNEDEVQYTGHVMEDRGIGKDHTNSELATNLDP